MNPMDVLAPNVLGGLTENSGVDQITANTGLGVQALFASTNPQAAQQRNETSNPAMFRDRQRTASARQFGMTKDAVVG